MDKHFKIKWQLLKNINTVPDTVAIKMCGKKNFRHNCLLLLQDEKHTKNVKVFLEAFN